MPDHGHVPAFPFFRISSAALSSRHASKSILNNELIVAIPTAASRRLPE
jgi:hypothetical protein